MEAASRGPRTATASLALLSLASYAVRSNISVAGKQIMPEFGVDAVQMGQVFAAFMVGYAIFQAPFGLLGDRFGARATLTAAAVVWAGLTSLTALLPADAFGALLAVRFLLGVAVAAMYPLAGNAIANGIPERHRSLANAVVVAGLAAGSALTPPLMTSSMLSIGWRAAFHVLAAAPLLAAGLWWLSAPPRQRTELRRAKSGQRLPFPFELAILSAAYFLESYIQYIFLFWFYLYLVDVRAFPLAQGGWLTALPYLLALGSMPLAGWASDRWGRTVGPLPARAKTSFWLLAAAGALLACGTASDNPWAAAIAIAASIALVLATEGPFWSSAALLAPEGTGLAGGIMNTAGNLAGIASTALVPVLAGRIGWPAVFYSTALLAVAAGALWHLVRIPATKVAIRESSHEYVV